MTLRRRRMLATLLALALCLSLLPMSALAAEADALGETGPEEAVCTCTAPCTEGGINTACPVCGAERAAPEDCGQSLPQDSGEPETRPLANEGISLLSTQEKVSYIDPTKEQTAQTCDSATVVTESDTSWGLDDNAEHWYVVNGDVTIGTRVTVTGDVHLILKDGFTLNATKGINVSEGNSLTIYAQSTGESMGTLLANDLDWEFAAIGSEKEKNAGTITICGGNFTVTGGIGASAGGAGIGSGTNGNGGTIAIHGGVVHASGNGGAGIGSGYKNNNTIQTNGGNIQITGGTVIVRSTWGDGIGGGWASNSGTFSTGSDGHAVIFANRIGDTDNTADWSGVIFQGTTGQVYGSNVTPTEDFEIPERYTLTIPNGTTLTIPEGVTLTNNGTINVDGGTLTNDGTIANNGTINGTVSGDVRYPSSVTVSLTQGGQSVESISYGSAITITATVTKQIATNALTADVGTVDFWLDEVDTGTKLGTAKVTSSESGTYTATLTLNDEMWQRALQ